MKPLWLLLTFFFSAGLAIEDMEAGQAGDDPANAEKDRAMLGISTASVSSSLREYLGLDPGFGIQIHAVVPGTPAAESGLQRKDILVQLNDQRLISPEHLALLINSHSPGDSVELHLIRQGERKKIDTTLGVLDPELVRTAVRPGFNALDSRQPHSLQDEMRKQQGIWEEWMRKRGESADGRSGEVKRDLEAPGETPDFPIHIFGKEGIVTIDNPGGSITLNTEGGETSITIRDSEGKIIHEGMYDPDKGMESLPEEARELLKDMKLETLSRFPMPELPRKKISSPPMPDAPPQAL